MGASRISVRRRQLLAVLLAAFGGVAEFAGASQANSQSQQNKTPVPRQPAAQPAAQPGSARATVWVNTASGYYHRPDSRHYGKTKRGKYMLEDDAIRAGFPSCAELIRSPRSCRSPASPGENAMLKKSFRLLLVSPSFSPAASCCAPKPHRNPALPPNRMTRAIPPLRRRKRRRPPTIPRPPILPRQVRTLPPRRSPRRPRRAMTPAIPLRPTVSDTSTKKKKSKKSTRRTPISRNPPTILPTPLRRKRNPVRSKSADANSSDTAQADNSPTPRPKKKSKQEEHRRLAPTPLRLTIPPTPPRRKSLPSPKRAMRILRTPRRPTILGDTSTKKKKSKKSADADQSQSADSSATSDSSTKKKSSKSKKSDSADSSTAAASSSPGNIIESAARGKIRTGADAHQRSRPRPAAPLVRSSEPPRSQPSRPPPPANSNGQVWVNTDSGVYHKPGTRWYGKTKEGKYMTRRRRQESRLSRRRKRIVRLTRHDAGFCSNQQLAANADSSSDKGERTMNKQLHRRCWWHVVAIFGVSLGVAQPQAKKSTPAAAPQASPRLPPICWTSTAPPRISSTRCRASARSIRRRSSTAVRTPRRPISFARRSFRRRPTTRSPARSSRSRT